MFQLLLATLAIIFVGRSFAGNVEPNFIEANLVPDLFSGFTPKAKIHVSFGSPGLNAVQPGMVLEASQLVQAPKWTLTPLTEDFSAPSFIPRVFTAVMMDIDSKTLHYLEGDFDARYVSSGSPSVKYAAPSPNARARYAMLVYEQNTLPNPDKNFAEVVSAEFGGALNAESFDIASFAKRMGITGPVAASVFFVEPSRNAKSYFDFNAATNAFKAQASMTNIAAVGAVAVGVFALARLRVFRRIRASRRE